MYIQFCTLFLLCITPKLVQSSTKISRVVDDEFIKLSSTEKYIIVLFTEENCEECNAIEDALIQAREELEESLSAHFLKIYNSNLVQIYSPTKEPALVFFRHGVPLLYHGEIDGPAIAHTFIENKEPTVRELDDHNFEHLTQAATGATTSDWFVMFYSKTCITSRRLTARWEAVGAALRMRMNVARVNRLEGGVATAKRFSVDSSPSFILFHHGNMYRYNLPNHDIDSFVHFATIGYKKIGRSEPVPLPKTPFDDLTQMIADYLAENNWLFGVGAVSLIVGLIISFWSRKKDDKTKKNAKKTKKN